MPFQAFHSKDTKAYKFLKELNDAIADDPILRTGVFVITSAVIGVPAFIILRLAGVL